MSRDNLRKTIGLLTAVLMLALVAMGAVSCAPGTEAEFLEDLLERTDSIGGEMTFVTKDGETVTITVTNTSAEASEDGEECGEKGDNDTPSLSEILPSLGSKEDVFKTLGVWEDAELLRDQGLSWSQVAEELGYTQESMLAALQEIIAERLDYALELGLINQEKYEYKIEYYGDLANKWVGKIFADVPSPEVDLEDILPCLNSQEDVFKTLGIWDEAELLRDEGLSWSQVAAELGYTEKKMVAALQEVCQQILHDAKVDGYITYEQYKYKLEYYNDLAVKWVGKIFDDVPSPEVDLEDILPSLNSQEDVFKMLGLWEEAESLRDEGLSWSQIAAELGYFEEEMIAELQEICQQSLHQAKVEGYITYEQYKYKLEYYNDLAVKWAGKVFAD